MGITETLAQKVVGTTYESLPESVVNVAREILLDGTANMLAGSQEPLGHIMSSYVHSTQGPPQATVVGHNFKTNVATAALANGTFCHSMDFELMWYPPTHPTGPTLPAFLALAEHRGFTGKDVVIALAIGFEIQGRLRVTQVGSGMPDPLHYPGSVGLLGSAAACARLLGLDVWKTRMALGIAGSRVSAIGANTGTMTKSTHCGNSARMGAECALLAEAGFTGNEDILETQGGYNSVFFKGGLNLDLLLQDFGDPYRMVDPGLNVKKYPAQYFTHWTIDATLDVRRKNNIMPEDIEHVEVEVGADNMAADRWPKTGLDGKFSIPYTVSAALLDGKVVIDTFRDERRFAPDMEAMLDRISFVKNPNIIAQDFAKAWSRVTVQTKDGKSYSSRVDRPLGIWDNPLPWQGRLAKFHDCASRVLLERQANEVVGLIERFETLDSVQPLMDLLRVPTAASK